MRAFLYCLPEPQSPPWLRDRYGGPAIATAIAADKSPSGERGFLFRHPDAPLPGLIDWHRFRPCEFVGWTPGEPPGPADLDRGLSLPALEIELRDGGTWRFPRVLTERGLDADREPGLPDILTVAGIDAPTERPYAGLIAQAESIRDRLTAGVDVDMPTLAELVDYVAALLGVHYRVGLAEVLALELLAHEAIDRMILASIDGLESLRVAVFEKTGTVLEA